MAYKNVNEAARDEHAVIGGVAGKKVFVVDNAGNQITSFGANPSIIQPVSIESGDIEIGAVEIKNGTDDTRAVVGTDGLQTHVKRYTTKIDEPDANTTYIGEVPSSIL